MAGKATPSRWALMRENQELRRQNDELREALRKNEEHFVKETTQLAEIINIQREFLKQDGIEVYEHDCS